MHKICFTVPFLWMTFYACSFYDLIDGHCSVYQNATKREAFFSSDVTLECSCNGTEGNRWKHLNKTIYLGRNVHDEYFSGNPSLISSYSLHIKYVSFLHTGIYVCICDFIVQKAYELFIKDLYITINGSETTNEILHLEMNKQHSIACHVNGTHSDDSLMLRINNHEVIPKTYEDGESSFVAEAVTQFNKTEGNITCVYVSKLFSATREIHVQFLTYASPHLYVTLNGSTNKERKFSFQENQNVLVECKATEARPSANLSLLINDRPVVAATNSLTQQNKLRYTTVTEHIFLSEEHIKITCIANGQYGFTEKRVQINISTYASPTLNFTVNREYIENSTTYYNDFDGVLLFSCYARGARPAVDLDWRISGSSQRLETFQDVINVYNSSFDTKSTLELKSVKGKVVVTCVTLSYFGIPQQNYFIEILPNVPNIASTTLITVCLSVCFVILVICLVKKTKGLYMEYVSTRTTEQVDCATEDEMEDIKADDSCLTRCQVTLLSRLPGEGTMRYWKAVSSSTVMGDARFVAKTVSETAPLKALYNFRDIAKEVINLAKHSNVVNTIGIAVENVPYYLYQEYIEYGSLRDYLMRNYQQIRRSQISTSPTIGGIHNEVDRKLKLTEFALGVSEGMSFLALKNFCHPALTSKKVLLTKTLACKIYDFVPERMSGDKVDYVLRQANAPLAWLPPETIFLRQYSFKADVWSLAVLMWEIYSLGDTPYAGMTSDEIEKEVRSGRCLIQPLCCPGGIFGVMLSAWDVVPEKRPTFEQIAMQIKDIKNSLKQESESQKHAAGTDEPSYFTLNDSDYDYVVT